jgi:YVTN family beta-propeller protein
MVQYFCAVFDYGGLYWKKTGCIFLEVCALVSFFIRVGLVLAFPLLFVSSGAAQRLPTGQRLHPSGRRVPVGGTFAMSAVAVPGRPEIVVACSGALQGLAVVDASTAKQTQYLPFQTLGADQTYTPTGSVYYGLALTGDGKTLYAARGSQDQIGIYSLAGGKIAETGALDEPTGDARKSNFASGLALNGPGSRLYAANNLSDTLAVFDVPGKRLLGTVPVAAYPLAVAAMPDGSKVYISSERDGVVSVVDPQRLTRIRDIPTGAHPDALLLTKDHARLFVANADSDTVSLIDTKTDTVLRTLLLRPSAARGLPGVTPTGLALAPDERTLYVTLADMNAVAVVALDARRDDGALRGYLPTGWYPTAVTLAPGGKTLCVVNAKGSEAIHPNPQGPNPELGQGEHSLHYIHDILPGGVSLIPVPDAGTLPRQTRQVLADNSVGTVLDADAAQTAKLLRGLPIKHVLYIIKENRTYDQVLGDLKAGNGDPSLVLFGQGVTPNLHALASQFVLLDNFYCCAEVSPDGWNWSTSGFANEYVQRNVPENYGEKRGSVRPTVRPYDYEGQNRDQPVSLQGIKDVAESPGGYIWDAVARRGLSLRDYGAFLTFGGDQPTKPAFVSHTCPDFAPFTMKYADSDAWVTLGVPSPGQDAYGPDKLPSRFSAWKREFDAFVKSGTLPAFELIRLPRDHTQGTAPGYSTPKAMAADNDYGVGEIVDAVSHSSVWASTAIVVVEDDAQNGPDHVDCHRSTAYVISPYIKRATVDHHFYNTDSLLHTMELLLGLSPMTRLDALAPPIRAFGTTPDLTPFTAILPDKTLLSQRNTRTAYGAAKSAHLNFSEADEVPDDVLNDILWHSIKGRQIPLPAPRHAADIGRYATERSAD